MPLEYLGASRNAITDLEPLRGARIASLRVDNNRVRSLEPLRGMPLRELAVAHNLIESVEPLKGAGIEVLDLGNNMVRELAPLAGTPLRVLLVDGNPAHDFAHVFAALPQLRSLDCSRMGLTTLEPLRQSALEQLVASDNLLTDVEPVQELPLRALYLSGNHIKSLAPLRSLPLRSLWVNECGLATLEELKGIRLSTLECMGNPLVTLDPFVDNPPPVFNFLGPDIPLRELARAERIWSRDSTHRRLVDQVRLCRALYHGPPTELRSLSKKWNGHSYLFLPMPLSVAQADSLSRLTGGYLVSVNTASEGEWIRSLRSGEVPFWVGVSAVHGRLQWADGTEVTSAVGGASEAAASGWVMLDVIERWPDGSRASAIVEWDN
jgi:hypothetical protein